MAIDNIPDDVINAYKKFAEYEAKTPSRLRDPSQKSASTKYFNQFIKACENNGLDYIIILPKLSMANDKANFTFENKINDAAIRKSIIRFIGERMVSSDELFDFINLMQENSGGYVMNPDWFNKNSQLVEGIIMGNRKIYQLTQRGKRYKNQSDTVGGMAFHPDNITNNMGWCDDSGDNPTTIGAAPSIAAPAAPAGGGSTAS